MRFRLLLSLTADERPERYRAVVLAANEFGVELPAWRGPYRETAGQARADGEEYMAREMKEAA